MRIFTHRYIKTLMVLAMFLLVWQPALANDPTQTSIAQPTEGDTVSDMTIIAGSVDFPNFERYEIFLKDGVNKIWVASGFTPIMNGNLARLDPRMFADGSYQLLVRQVRQDSNYAYYEGPTFYIDNPLDAPLPYYPEIEPSFLYAAEDRAIIRVKNCSGFDLTFDYNSPQGFRSGGSTKLQAKRGDAICTFEDIALIPGEYQGTAKEESTNPGSGYTLMAEAGKVYEVLYNGGSGEYQLLIQETSADGRATANTMIGPAQSSSMPAEVSSPPATEPQAKSQMLPQAGAEMAAQSPSPFIIASIGFVLLIVMGGLVTFLQRSQRFI